MTKINHLLTIITIVKNGAGTIERCVSSIVKQKTRQIEYILIDGASTDGTKVVIESYIDDIDILMSETDHGISDAMNKGIQLASGHFILFVHADDYLEEGAISTLLTYIASDPIVQFIHCFGVNLYNSQNQFITTSYSRIKLISRESSIHHAAVLMPRNLLLSLGGFDTKCRFAMDYDSFLRAYKKNQRFVNHMKVVANRTLAGVSYQNRRLAMKELVQIRSNYNSTQNVWFWYYYSLVKDELGRILKKSSLGIRAYRFIWKKWNKKRSQT